VHERDEETAEGAPCDERSTGDRQRGPWLLALGTLAIGVLAFLVAGARRLVDRLRRERTGQESPSTQSDRSRR